jgi:uridine phosphorylase
MPTRLRPTASFAADAILVGDPGRALLLAQELLEQPKMSNHARGLWGYTGTTPAGQALTIQSTGIGGPSAALVLGDLAKLGVRRAVRVGTCVGLDDAAEPGELLIVTEAIAAGGSAAALGVGAGEAVRPDRALTERLEREVGEGRAVAVASFDAHPQGAQAPADVAAADMQTAPLLARAASLGIKAAALLVVAEKTGDGGPLEKDALEVAEKHAGRAALVVLSV